MCQDAKPTSTTTSILRDVFPPFLERAPDTADWWLASCWNSVENEMADVEEGAFAAYLRRGSCHYGQTRGLVPLKLPLDTEEILHAGYLEPNKHFYGRITLFLRLSQS